MSYKNRLVQTLFYVLTLITVPALAMDSTAPRSAHPEPFEGRSDNPNHAFAHQERRQVDRVSTQSNNHIIKIVMATFKLNPFESTKLKVKIRVQTPESATTDTERNAYYASRKTEIHGKLQQALVAYEKVKMEGPIILGNPLTVIRPTELFYIADANRLMLRQNCQTHKLTNTVTACLETRLDCVYSPQKEEIIPGEIKVHITLKPSDKKHTVPLNSLRKMYPFLHTLNLNPENMGQRVQQVLSMSIERGCGLVDERNPDDLPNPEKYMNDLFIEDLRTMVTYYVSTQNILPVD